MSRKPKSIIDRLLAQLKIRNALLRELVRREIGDIRTKRVIAGKTIPLERGQFIASDFEQTDREQPVQAEESEPAREEVYDRYYDRW